MASSLTGIPYMRVSVQALWYCAALLIPWVVVAAWPWASIGLLGLMAGK